MSERNAAQLDVRRLVPRLVVGIFVVVVLLYIIVLADPAPDLGGNWRTTTFGSALDDWDSFVRTLLNGLTFAGLLFIVASGFSLIFGLMRVVNMAYGSFYLVGGYIAYEVQQKMTGSGFTIPGSDVTTWDWVFPAIVAAGCVGLVGLVVQQVFLSWNQGQELRQALITIAISVIIADQTIAHFNSGLASSVTWPGWTNQLVELPLLGVRYSVARLVVLFLGLAVGAALWVWLYRTRTGMVIRAGVDDLQMTSALGVNIRRTLAIAFVVGSALAAFGGVVGASQGAIAPGQDGQWLLNSLVVVIIGGMGSLLGAAVGSLLYGLTFSFAAVYLPTIGDNCCTQYSIVFTFILLALVLAFRPQGLFGEVLVSGDPKQVTERAIGAGAIIVALLAPAIFNDYWLDAILTQMLIVGIAAASLIFLAAYGGMISLAQTMLAGTAGFILGNMVTVGGEGGESKGLALGWDPTLSLVLAILGTTLIGIVFGAIAARSTGIYFLMITLTFSVIGFYFVGQVTVVSGFSGIGGINAYTPPFVGDIVDDRYRLYYIALGVALVVYSLIRFLVRTPFGLSLQGVRDEPVRMSSLGYAVPLHRTLAFGLSAFFAALSGVLLVWWQGQIAPGDIGLPATIDLLIVAVIGGLTRIEGAWVGALAFIVISNYVRDSWLTRVLDDVGIGGSFNTIIGLIFLLIVIVSPDGLVGLWDRIWRRFQRHGGGGPDSPVVPVATTGSVAQEA